MILKELILTVSTMGGCVDLERTDFKFLLWERVVINYDLISTVSTMGECSGLERTDC